MGNNFHYFLIFLDVSESDNSISWCLQGQQTWEQFLVFNFDFSTIYRNPALFWKELFCAFHWSLHSLGFVQRWCSFLFRLSPGFFWTHRKLFVTFNMRIMFTWIKTWWYRFLRQFICVFSTQLPSTFFIFIWSLKFMFVEWNYFWYRLQIRIVNDINYKVMICL